jgi:hypothetical protein
MKDLWMQRRLSRHLERETCTVSSEEKMPTIHLQDDALERMMVPHV